MSIEFFYQLLFWKLLDLLGA